MSSSIIQRTKECYICQSICNLEEHHIFYGTSNRKMSEKYGLKVFLCMEHHRGTYGVHGKYSKELNEKLHKVGQKAFEKHYKSENFLQVFGKNYL